MILRSLRAEIDALLGFLQSDSRMEKAKHEAQKRKRIRSRTCSSRTSRASCRLPSQKEQLATLVEALLLEIAAALAAGEVGDDQDHG